MKKKILYIIFTLLFIFSLAACTKNEENQNNGQNNNKAPDPNGGGGGNNNQKKEEEPKLPEEYYTNLVDTSSAYKFSINKLLMPINPQKITDSLEINNSYIEFNLTDDLDFEVYGDISFKLIQSLKLSANKNVKFYMLDTDVYYELTDNVTETKEYKHIDLLEIPEITPYLTKIDEELTKYFNLTVSDTLTNKEFKQSFIEALEQSFVKVLEVVLKFEIKENTTLSFNYEGLKKLNDRLANEPVATSIDSIFGPFTFLTLKNVLCGTVTKSLFDYKMSDIFLAEQYSGLSIDNIEADINTYLPKLNALLGEKKLPFNSVSEFMQVVAAKFEIEISEDITLKEFLQIEELTSLTINDIVDKFVGSHIDLKGTCKVIFDLCYKYSFYQLLESLTMVQSLDQIPTVIAQVGQSQFKDMVDSVIEILEQFELKVVTDNTGKLSKATFKFIPDDLIIDFDIEFVKITFESKESFKEAVLGNL